MAAQHAFVAFAEWLYRYPCVFPRRERSAGPATHKHSRSMECSESRAGWEFLFRGGEHPLSPPQTCTASCSMRELWVTTQQRCAENAHIAVQARYASMHASQLATHALLRKKLPARNAVRPTQSKWRKNAHHKPPRGAPCSPPPTGNKAADATTDRRVVLLHRVQAHGEHLRCAALVPRAAHRTCDSMHLLASTQLAVQFCGGPCTQSLASKAAQLFGFAGDPRPHHQDHLSRL